MAFTENIKKMYTLIFCLKISLYQSASGVEMKVNRGSIESAPGLTWCSIKWTLVHSQLNPNELSFKPQKHFEMNLGSVLVLKKARKTTFQKVYSYLVKAINLKIYLYDHGKKYFFNVGIPLTYFTVSTAKSP